MVHIDTKNTISVKADMIIKRVSIVNTMIQVFLDTIHGIDSSVGWIVVNVSFLVPTNCSVKPK